MSQNQMFCYQCEQTAKGQGCTVMGVCGKTPEVANLQDLLVYKLRELSQLALQAQKAGLQVDEKTGVFAAEALFATLTNVNFDPQAIIAYLQKTQQLQQQLQAQLKSSTATMPLESTMEGLVAQGKRVGIKADTTIDLDLHSLQWLLTYGLKGVAAYAYHAYLLGKRDDTVFNFIYQGLAAPLDKSLGVNDFVGLVFKCGEINIRAMELLDAGNTERYGHPVPTKVPLGAKAGKAILVSGHDLEDLEEILKQSQGKGIYVYTHVARANDYMFKRKVGAAVVTARRAGGIPTFDAINHFFLISQMIVPGSSYWNVGMGAAKGDVEKDEEGLETMDVLGKNMAWLLKKLKS